MTPDQLDQQLNQISRMMSSTLNRFEGIRTEMLDRMTAPNSSAADGASDGMKLSLRALEDQISLTQRALGRGGDIPAATSMLETCQHVIGILRHEAGDPRPLDANSPPIQPEFTPVLDPDFFGEIDVERRPISTTRERLPGVVVPIETHLHPDLHDAPPHVGQLVGSYTTGDDAAKARILNTPVADGGPYSSEQLERWKRALQHPAEQVNRGDWSDKSGDKPEAVGSNE